MDIIVAILALSLVFYPDPMISFVASFAPSLAKPIVYGLLAILFLVLVIDAVLAFVLDVVAPSQRTP